MSDLPSTGTPSTRTTLRFPRALRWGLLLVVMVSIVVGAKGAFDGWVARYGYVRTSLRALDRVPGFYVRERRRYDWLPIPPLRWRLENNEGTIWQLAGEQTEMRSPDGTVSWRMGPRITQNSGGLTLRHGEDEFHFALDEAGLLVPVERLPGPDEPDPSDYEPFEGLDPFPSG